MRKRVSVDDDYIDELAAAIADKTADDGGEIPWKWWREKADLYGVTPNNIYSRAIQRGLYVPRSRKESRSAANETGAVSAVTPRTPVAVKANDAGSRGKGGRASTRLLSERLGAMADMAEALGEMEDRVAELERERDRDAARRREVLANLARMRRSLEESIGLIAAMETLYSDE